jgi:hypothetical protein
VPELIRTAPEVRRQDYLTAFEFYLKVPTKILPRIVFAENSDSDVSAFRELADRLGQGKEVFVTSHQGNDHPPSYGRAYGELKLLDRIIGDFEPVASLPDDALIWKGTGRHILRNIGRLIETAPRSYDLYCDLKNRPMHWFDMRFFSVSKAGYHRFFMGRFPEVRDGHSYPEPKPREVAEIMIRRWIGEQLPDPRIFPRFRVEPVVEGIRGYDNSPYASGKGLAKHYLRKVSRTVTPWIWI